MNEIVKRLTERLYGSGVIRNDVRGELVEEIVAYALGPDWELCGGDWGACDLRHRTSGLQVQVKQSSARQSWTSPASPREPRFSIQRKTGRWEGAIWIAEPGRNADVFVFGWHDRADDGCDHRDPSQWQFFIVMERKLPDQASISLSGLKALTSPVAFVDLQTRVQEATAA